MGVAVDAQVTSDFFGHLHYTPASSNKYDRSLVFSTDSTISAFRPTATAAIGYSATGGTTILAFAGIGYFHVTHKAATNTYYNDWGVSAQIGTGASNGSVSLANATTVGLFGQFFNSLLTVGVGYNFANRVAMPLLGPGIAFH
jgi:hypothetical protein